MMSHYLKQRTFNNTGRIKPRQGYPGREVIDGLDCFTISVRFAKIDKGVMPFSRKRLSNQS